MDTLAYRLLDVLASILSASGRYQEGENSRFEKRPTSIDVKKQLCILSGESSAASGVFASSQQYSLCADG